jgi:multiple sugar transport system ATP-binding protein
MTDQIATVQKRRWARPTADATIVAPLASIVFDHVTKVYPDGTRAVEDLSLAVGDGEFLVLVGPSGCGKTTAMLMIAGLEDITEGAIRIGDRVVNDLEPRERDVAMVFQNYALYPHMTVYQNLAFGLQMKKTPKKETDRRVREIAAVLGLQDMLERKPKHLSGGQRQRVAMGRAIVRDPRVFLMDEPLSNLDAKLRVQMRAEISRIQRQLSATTVYVTHDQVEAMTMGDRVAVLRKGRLQQLDTPAELYRRPANLFVASFIGSPEMNLVQAQLEREGEGLVARVGEQALDLPPAVLSARPALERHVGRTIALGIRPEHLDDPALGSSADGQSRLKGVVQLTEVLGAELLVHLEVAADPVRSDELLEVARDVDVTVAQDLAVEARRRQARFVGRFDMRSKIEIDQAVEVTVETEHMHFFDLDSGLAITDEET